MFKSLLVSFGAGIAAAAVGLAAYAKGDLSRQDPITLTVDLGTPGKHEFVPNVIKFETGKLYKLVLQQPEQRSALLHVACLQPARVHPQGAGDAGA